MKRLLTIKKIKKLLPYKRYAFTLSEVLITLGVIGVVAAITLPVIIQQYQKQVVISRMKKFYTTFNQALQMAVNENGDMETWIYTLDYMDGEGAYQFWNRYLRQYMQYTKEVENKRTVWPTNGVDVYLPDGSAFNFGGGLWITFYPFANKRNAKNSHEVFLFEVTKKGLFPRGYDRSLYSLQNDPNEYCKKSGNASKMRTCAAIIIKDGWQITNNYPW